MCQNPSETFFEATFYLQCKSYSHVAAYSHLFLIELEKLFSLWEYYNYCDFKRANGLMNFSFRVLGFSDRLTLKAADLSVVMLCLRFVPLVFQMMLVSKYACQIAGSFSARTKEGNNLLSTNFSSPFPSKYRNLPLFPFSSCISNSSSSDPSSSLYPFLTFFFAIIFNIFYWLIKPRGGLLKTTSWTGECNYELWHQLFSLFSLHHLIN